MTPAMQHLRAEIGTAAARGYPFYVYALSDGGGVFYIGKGQRGRIFDHRRLRGGDANAAKQMRIRAAGAALTHAVLAYFNDEDCAYAHEASLIAALPGLTNLTLGDPVPPIERARLRAQEMIDRVVPFEQWNQARAVLHLKAFGVATPRELYDRLLAAMAQEVQEPTPTTFYFNRQGQVTGRGYNQRHSFARGA